MKQRMHVWIYGIVKGVSFRANVKEWADRFGLKGFVRNTEKNVEAIFEGDKEKVVEMLEFCRKGPSFARVDRIEIKEETYQAEFKEFKILHF
ncbi:acylphosphatase [Candidatus Pacearchaeota archaeon]|nr:acylphosphatase [Candidatus Pacearchaeota archaeon]